MMTTLRPRRRGEILDEESKLWRTVPRPYQLAPDGGEDRRCLDLHESHRITSSFSRRSCQCGHKAFGIRAASRPKQVNRSDDLIGSHGGNF